MKDHSPDETILLVTHGDLGKMIYAAHYHLNWEEALSAFDFENGQIISLKLT